jgi:pimeloyl-ACP methyl ester carboxylesterase
MRKIYFVPGILGSELLLDGDKIWPPTLCEIDSEAEVDKLLDPHVTVGDVIGKVGLVFPMYSTIMDALGRIGGATNSHYAPWPYDWRKDLVDTCAEFAKLLASTVAGDEIVLIAHSMGGLIVRGILEDPAYHSAAWRGRVSLAVFLATPHNGAVDAVKTVTGLDAAPGLTTAQSKRLNSNPSYSACYQLFPSLSAPTLWSGPTYDPLTLSSGGAWADLGLDQRFLAPISNFRGRLDVTRKPDSCRYFAIVSAAHDTSTSLARADANSPFQDHPFPTAGDGTVEIESATALRCQTLFVTGSHVGVTQASETTACLKALLGAPVDHNLIAAVLPSVKLSVSPQFLLQGETAEIVLNAGVNGPLKGAIEITDEAGVVATRSVAIDADVPGMSKLSMIVPFPDKGEFKIVFQPSAGLLGSNETHVFVRSANEQGD